MGATLTRWEASIFTGDKNIVGSLELDGYLAADTTTGSEKATNPNFTGSATGWTVGAAWAYNANAVDKNADGTTTLSQDVGAVANEIYRVVFTVSNWTVGTVTVAVGGVSGTARGADGTYTEYIKATGTGSLTFTPTNTARFTIDTVSVTRVAVSAADRVVMWTGDRLSAGVAQAGKASLFFFSEPSVGIMLGDRIGIGASTANAFTAPAARVHISAATADDVPALMVSADAASNYGYLTGACGATNSGAYDAFRMVGSSASSNVEINAAGCDASGRNAYIVVGTGKIAYVIGSLSVSAGVFKGVTDVTDTYIILATDSTIVCNKATPFTVTLPTAVLGQIFNIKNIGAGTVTVDGDGGDTIDGAASQNVVQWASLTVQCRAANTWIII